MKYQSPLWKCVAALLALGLVAKLLSGTQLPSKITGLFRNETEQVQAGAEESAPVYDDWLAGESPVLVQTKPAATQPQSIAAMQELKPKTILPMVNNLTASQPDYAELLKDGWQHSLKDGKPQILIIHTHSSEAYTAVGEDAYEATDPYRTTDISKSVVKVGAELARCLREQGFEVLHDSTLFDYPGYSGSYTRSLKAVETWLDENPDIRVVIDLHRDSLGNAYRTEYDNGSEKTAQLMLMITNGESGLYHPNWEENLKLALSLQCELQRRYEGLARELCLSPYRYNQHLSPGYMLLEVGTDGNTLSEAEAAVRLFAECAGEVLKEQIK